MTQRDYSKLIGIFESMTPAQQEVEQRHARKAGLKVLHGSAPAEVVGNLAVNHGLQVAPATESSAPADDGSLLPAILMFMSLPADRRQYWLREALKATLSVKHGGGTMGP